MTLDREPAIAAARAKILQWQSNVFQTSMIWQCVNAALDAIEEQAALGTAHLSVYWVIVYTGPDGKTTVMSVCSTRARARRALKQIMAGWDGDRRHYTISKVPGLEIPGGIRG